MYDPLRSPLSLFVGCLLWKALVADLPPAFFPLACDVCLTQVRACYMFAATVPMMVALALLGTVLAKETCDPFESFALHPATKGGHARPTAIPAPSA